MIGEKKGEKKRRRNGGRGRVRERRRDGGKNMREMSGRKKEGTGEGKEGETEEDTREGKRERETSDLFHVWPEERIPFHFRPSIVAVISGPFSTLCTFLTF